MNRYRYPIHRQNGGPMVAPPPGIGGPPMAGPPMAGPPMAGPPELPPEGIENALIMQMSEGVSQAQDTTQLIDAIRGNNMPLQARYDELATYVGPQDASATPETVLALVQPTFAMTEQGVMDSGISQLLQQTSPPPPMGAPPGMNMPPPRPLNQGVGGLGMPMDSMPLPVAQGGAVKKFQAGGEASLADLYEEEIQTIKELMTPTEEAKRLAKAELFFDGARAMAGFAGNVDAQGRQMSGSTAARFAQSAAPVLSEIPKANRFSVDAEAASRQAALGSALNRRTAQDLAAARMAEASARATTTLSNRVPDWKNAYNLVTKPFNTMQTSRKN